MPPDLAVEVVSPGNRRARPQEGRRIPRGRDTDGLGGLSDDGVSVAVYRPDEEEPIVFGDGEFLENFPELPGFRCPVADFFV